MKEAEHIQPGAKTANMIKDWDKQSQRVSLLELQLIDAKIELANRERDLALHLTPDDRRTGEVFQIWFGDGLLSVRFVERPSKFELSWRQHPTGTVE